MLTLSVDNLVHRVIKGELKRHTKVNTANWLKINQYY
ncbi:hypothetical protein XMG59_000296 [Marinobacterium sp. xm-g-59]|nr:hypothetical protein [Marinobacterium sp. xm-g-59]